jgi:hypothetical protein
MRPDYYERAAFAIEPEAMTDEETPKPAQRGVPLVATWVRLVAMTVLFATAVLVAAEAYVTLHRSGRTLASLWPAIALSWAAIAAVVWATLHAEELRLARELRTARSGSSMLRTMLARRRDRAPSVARLLSTKLGMAAVLLADGDRPVALQTIARTSLLMQGGRLEKLRHVVDADLERATGTPAALDRCVQRLSGMAAIGNREADLYRTHVLVKSLLEQGDVDGALDLARRLTHTRDEEEHVYVAWLRTWFELDSAASDGSWPPMSEGELRRAALLARTHGAEKLVEKLEARLVAIARPVDGE